MDLSPLTIPQLAQLLRVTPAAIRYWINAGWIKPPDQIDGSGNLAYSRLDVVAIKWWHLKRAAAGLCRGIGAERKRLLAMMVLARSDEGPTLTEEKSETSERIPGHADAQNS